MTARRVGRSRVVVGGLALAALVACADPGTPAVDDPTEPAPSSTGTPSEPAPNVVPVDDVRSTLGAIDPCGLLGRDGDGDGVRARYAQGPHTCEAQLDGVRVRVEVGIPVDDTTEADAERGELDGLPTLTAQDGCLVVFPVAASHGISVSADERCDVVPQAAELVGSALASPDIDDVRRAPGPDAHTACGLMGDAASDPALLVDAAGDRLQGLDHCELDSGPALARSGVSIDYSSTPFDEVARLLEGDRVELAGLDAVVVDGETGCYVHTFLWETEAEGRGSVHAEAVVRAADCAEARRVAAVVIRTAGNEPAAPGSVADLVATSAS